MGRTTGITICLLFILVIVTGCMEQDEKLEKLIIEHVNIDPSDMIDKSDQTTGNPFKDEAQEIFEFAIHVGDGYYEVNPQIVHQSIMEAEQTEVTLEDHPYPEGKIYYGDGVTVSTFGVDDERGKGEIIHRILATKNARVPRDVGIGDTLSDLQAAYVGVLAWCVSKWGIGMETRYITYQRPHVVAIQMTKRED